MISRAASAIGLAAAVLLSLGCASVLSAGSDATGARQEADCRMAEADESWLRDALRNWPRAERELIRLGNRPLPPIVIFDARCAYGLEAGTEEPHRWSAAPHGGQIRLPNGTTIPPAPNAFNAAGQRGSFLVMSLPSIWAAAGAPTEISLGAMLEGILFHELSHSLQSTLTPSVSFIALQARYGLPESVNDDSVQERFAGNTEYRDHYAAERDLLYRSAAAASDAEARAAACEALARLRERRRRYFAGAEAVWERIDEVSLTTEGFGQWVSYAWLTRGRGLAPAALLPRMRGGYWSQDEGLALFLVVDRLVPGWQRRLLAPEPETAKPLLERACGR